MMGKIADGVVQLVDNFKKSGSEDSHYIKHGVGMFISLKGILPRHNFIGLYC